MPSLLDYHCIRCVSSTVILLELNCSHLLDDPSILYYAHISCRERWMEVAMTGNSSQPRYLVDL